VPPEDKKDPKKKEPTAGPDELEPFRSVLEKLIQPGAALTTQELMAVQSYFIEQQKKTPAGERKPDAPAVPAKAHPELPPPPPGPGAFGRPAPEGPGQPPRPLPGAPPAAAWPPVEPAAGPHRFDRDAQLLIDVELRLRKREQDISAREAQQAARERELREAELTLEETGETVTQKLELEAKKLDEKSLKEWKEWLGARSKEATQ